MSASILRTDDVSLVGFRQGDLDCLRKRSEVLLAWFEVARYAHEPWSSAEPASIIDVLGTVGFIDLRRAHGHALTLTRLAAHAAARASQDDRDIASFGDFLQELLDTYDVLTEHRVGGDATDALGENATLPTQKSVAGDRVETCDLGGHDLGEGAPLAQHVGELVAVDHDPAAGLVGHRVPLWLCPSCGACIGLIGRALQALGVSPHRCRRPAQPGAAA